MSYARITFCGLNVARILNILCKKGIKLQDVTRQNKQVSLTVSVAHERQVVALLTEKCYQILSVERIGKVKRVAFAKRHFVVIAMLVLFVVLSAILSNFCVKIVVYGDFDKQLVLQNLAQLQVDKGCNLKKLNVDNVENALTNKLDAMYAVITRKGSVLYVNAIAKKTANTPIDMSKRRDIVAPTDGVVKWILCEQGCLQTQVGAFVRKGDVLIKGARVFADGSEQDVYALGKVLLEQSVTAFAPYTGSITTYQKTGKTFCCNQVVLFDKSYGKSCPFEHFESQVTCTKLSPLNLEIKRVTFFELAKVTLSATFEECLPILTQQAMEQAVAKCNFTVTSSQFATTNNGVSCTLFGQIEIS